MAEIEGRSRSSPIWEQVVRIMGKNEAENFMHFFLSICFLCIQYVEESKAFVVALITRRCHVLFEIFCGLAHEDEVSEKIQSGYFGTDFKTLTPKRLDDIYRNYFITDNALLASVEQLAKFYNLNGTLPELVIVDELLIHGRALNHLLLELEGKLADAIRRQHCCEVDGEKIAAKVEERLHLKIFARNKCVLLLLLRYAKEGRLDCVKEYDADKWKTLSLHFARVVSIAPVNNVAYAWSFEVDDNLQRRLSSQKVVGDVPFQRIETELRGYKQTTDLLLYPTKENPKVLFTIRGKRSLTSFSGEKNGLYVPYIIYDQLQWAGVWNLHQHICEDLLAKSKSEEDPVLQFFRGDDLFGEDGPSEEVARSYYRWCVQTNDLVLNALMMRVWMEQYCELSKSEQREMIESINWEQVSRNYHYLIVEQSSLRVKNSREKLKKLWDRVYDIPLEADFLSCYLDVLTKDSGSVLPKGWESAENPSEEENRKERLEWAVQKAVYTIGLDAEINAYDRYGSGLVFSERTLANWGDHYSLQDIITKSIQEYTRSKIITDREMYYLLALITQAMDLGHVGMEPICGEKSWMADTEENVYTLIKAGEQSLFIEPFRYRNYLPVLSLIEERYQESWADQLIEIGSFVRRLKNAGKVSKEDYEDLYYELRDFVKGLYLSGQTVSLWNGVQLSEQVDKESYSAWEQTLQDRNERAAYLRIYQGY